MGQVLSNRNRRYRPRKYDAPYVDAIHNLDWKHHLGIDDRQELDDAIMERNLVQTDLPVAISNDVFISNANMTMERLQELQITHVLNMGGQIAARIPPEHYQEAGIDYKEIDALDMVTYPMLDKHWQEASEYLQNVRSSQGKCVVHCMAGMNRSGIIVAADYMLYTKKNVLETVLHCRICRGNSFLENGGFQQQLVAMARQEGLLGPAPGEPGCIVQTKIQRRGSKSIAQLFQ